MVLQVQTSSHNSCDITNLVVIQVSHFCTSINMSIVMLVMAIYFCTVEIESLSYHYQPQLPQTLDALSPSLSPFPDDPPFRYNPLHDIESIWWVGVWFLFCHREATTMSEANLADAQTQLLHVQKLFPRVLKSFDRVEKFQNRRTFANGISFLPSSFRQAAQRLESG